ncbi:pyruvate/2-oxoglutarate dehydrogenase complex,dihydrolipoamide dehydrogenase (E3) component, partial [filamentous cyanobacterium Phorm 46]
MKILDSQGRLFGKLSILDVGAAMIVLLVAVGIFLFPGTSGGSVAQVGGQSMKP